MWATLTRVGLLALLLCHAVALDNDQVLIDVAAETEIGVAAAASSQGQGSTVPGSARPATVEHRRNSVSPTGLAGTFTACMW